MMYYKFIVKKKTHLTNIAGSRHFHFINRGRLFIEGENLFKPTSWLAVLYGQRLYPSGYDPMSVRWEEKKADVFVGDICQSFVKATDAMPLHD